MNTHLIHGYLDHTLADGEMAQFNELLKTQPEFAQAFVRSARLHNLLHDHLQSTRRIEANPDTADRNQPVRRRRWISMTLGVCVSLTLVAVGIFYAIQPNQELTAATEMQRLIDQGAVPGDRTYRIRSLDKTPETAEAGMPPIDGALLLVRYPDQYVLARKYPDGRPYVTGCDGERSWSAPPDRPVRVSADPSRFRGPVPGHRIGLLYADLKLDLIRIRESYNIVLIPADSQGLRGVRAEKKSKEHPGPRSIELRYQPHTGTIVSFRFEGMPQARSGPVNLILELISQDSLGPQFFHHHLHHPVDQRVIEED